MKKLLIIFLFIFTIFGSACPSQAEDFNVNLSKPKSCEPGFVYNVNPSKSKLYALGPPTMMMIISSSGWSCEYDVCETFEASEFDNTEGCGSAPCIDQSSDGAVNGNTLNSGLDSGIYMDGTYCAAIDYNGAYFDVVHTATPSTNWNTYYLFHWAYNNTLGAEKTIAEIYDTTDSRVAYLNILTDGSFKLVIIGASTATSSTGIVSVDSDIWFQIRYHNGSTTDESYMTVKYWTGSAWSSSVNLFFGDDTDMIDTIRFVNNQTGSTDKQYVDSVFIDSYEFTNAPSTYLP